MELLKSLAQDCHLMSEMTHSYRRQLMLMRQYENFIRAVKDSCKAFS
jgi:hypothetical protein